MPKYALALLLLCLFPAVAPAQTPRPNVVFILIDDLGQRDLACYGSTFYETPNIDALARSGIRFTDAYSACNVCSPTRASILTGKYPARLQLTDWLPGRKDAPNQKLNRPQIVDRLDPAEVTLPQALKQAGYATGFVGKWHLGPKGFWPDRYGFDVNVGGCGLGHPPSYFSPYGIPALPDGPEGEYLTDRLTTEACKFIESNKDKPFLLYLSHYAVHNPQQAKPGHVEKFKAKLAASPAPAGEELIDDLGRKVRQVQNNPTYAGNVYSMDESVGRVLKTLADLKLDQNTIVVFTSDNGGLSTAEGTPTSNAPLRMGKGWNHEGGIRVPLIVRCPGVTKPGTTSDQPVISTDHYPTLLEAAHLPARPDQHVDGRSFLAALKGEPLAERPLFWHYPHYSNQGGPPSGAVRVGDFKLIESYETMKAELYNLKDDPREQSNLAAANPDKTKDLQSRLHAWRESVHAAMPTPNPEYDPNWKPPAGQRRANRARQE